MRFKYLTILMLVTALLAGCGTANQTKLAEPPTVVESSASQQAPSAEPSTTQIAESKLDAKPPAPSTVTTCEDKPAKRMILRNHPPTPGDVTVAYVQAWSRGMAKLPTASALWDDSCAAQRRLGDDLLRYEWARGLAGNHEPDITDVVVTEASEDGDTASVRVAYQWITDDETIGRLRWEVEQRLHLVRRESKWVIFELQTVRQDVYKIRK